MRSLLLKIIILFIALSSSSTFVQTATYAGEDQLNPKITSYPTGDFRDGKISFENFGCVKCHGIDLAGKDDIAPRLQFDASTPDEKIITSILVPSHAIAFGFGKGNPEDPQVSDMPNLWEQMTVKELLNIVAYLKHQQGEIL